MNKIFIFLIVLISMVACKNNDLNKKEFKLVVYTQGLNNNHLPIEIQKLFEPIAGQCENEFSPFSSELNSPILKRIDTNFNGQFINIPKDKILDFKNLSSFRLEDNFTIENKQISNLELLDKVSQFKSTDLAETFILNENSGLSNFNGIPIVSNIIDLKNLINNNLCENSKKQITVIYLSTIINDELVTNYQKNYKIETKEILASNSASENNEDLNEKVETTNTIEKNNSLVTNNNIGIVKTNDVSNIVKPVVNNVNEPKLEATKDPQKTTLDELINDTKSDYIPPIKKEREIKKQIEKSIEKPIVETIVNKPKAIEVKSEVAKTVASKPIVAKPIAQKPVVLKPIVSNTPAPEVKATKTKKPKTTEPLEGIWNRKAEDVKNDNQINSKDIRKKG